MKEKRGFSKAYIEGGVTVRSFLVGSLLCFVLAVGTTYNIMVIHGSYMALDFSTPAAIFLFFVLTFCINPPLAKLNERLALTTPELKVIYMMLVVACALPTMGMAAQILPILTSAFYYALPENNWAELIHPYIKPWLVPQDKLAIKYFYEGLPSWETEIPWRAWARPLAVWGVFLLALYIVMIAFSVILRRQWMERERLVYPLAQLPIEMAERGEGSVLSPIYKNGLLWVGFAIAFILSSLNGLHHYFPVVPRLQLVRYIPVFRHSHTLIFRLSFPMLGFFYLVHLDVAFSLWFFNILSLLARGFMTYFGIRITENLGIYGARSPLFAHLGMGAITVLVVAGFWNGRRHLKDVARKAVLGARDVDDSDEIMSYRAAFWSLILGLGFMGVWLHLSGMPAWAVPIFLFAVFVIFIGLTRIVAESGMAEAVASTIGSSFVVSSFGSRALGPEGLVSMGLTYVWSADVRTFVMASCTNGLKVIDDRRIRKRPVFWAVMASIVITSVTAIWMIMKLAYERGGLNGNPWFFGGGAKAPYNYVASKLLSPEGPNWTGWYIKGAGALIMGMLMILRARFLWWPFHPIGFAIGPIWIMDQIWFTCFLAWMIKLALVRWGGLKVYRSARPIFLGLILGQFVCNGVWILIDLIAGGRGNQIFWI
ncbi:hypothetical protein DRP77_04250 [Candidatus Poribacteria bacterium]|nr:MAG: hypothetical protein DRP77_04250 [Candidatus Poribacteria bacterium]